jgi:hypothetical protein
MYTMPYNVPIQSRLKSKMNKWGAGTEVSEVKDTSELISLLKSGEYDGRDIMQTWCRLRQLHGENERHREQHTELKNKIVAVQADNKRLRNLLDRALQILLQRAENNNNDENRTMNKFQNCLNEIEDKNTVSGPVATLRVIAEAQIRAGYSTCSVSPKLIVAALDKLETDNAWLRKCLAMHAEIVNKLESVGGKVDE